MQIPPMPRPILTATLALALIAHTSGSPALEAVQLDTKGTIRAETVVPDGDAYQLTLPTLPNDVLRVPAGDVVCRGASWCLAQADVSTQRPAVPPALSGRIEIHGSNTVGEALMPALIEALAAKAGLSFEVEKRVTDERTYYLLPASGAADQPVATVDLFAHGSGTALRAMIDRRAPIGMRSSPMPAAELDEAQRAGLGDLRDPANEHVIGLDGLAIIVHRDNLVGALSTDQIAKIFAGKISDWAEVGGRPGAITLYRRDDKSGTTDTFNALVMAPSKEKINFSAKPFEVSEKLVDEVTLDPGGIGYVGLAYVGNKARALSIRSSCGVPVKPTVFAIKAGEYPLARRLFLYTPASLTQPLAKLLVDFATSEEANQIADGARFVSRANAFLPFDQQSQRLLQIALDRDPSPADTRAFVQDVQASQRASITFRFRAGGIELDSQGLRDLRRLGNALSDEAFRTRRFVIAGFTSEKEGGSAEQRALSQKRANQVATALRNYGAMLFAENTLARGYGSGAPVACNSSPAEQELNQRVEVWIDQ